MHISDMMGQALPFAPDVTVAEAALLLHQHGTSAGVVVSSDGRPVGMLTEGDVVRSLADGLDPATTTVGTRMSADVVVVRVDHDAPGAHELMRRHGFRHLPVVDGDGKLVGMLSNVATAGLPPRARRPATDFGAPGLLAHIRGPFGDGPPPEALDVEELPLGDFRLRELRRVGVIGAVLPACVLKELGTRLWRRDDGSWRAAASRGLVDGFEVLGPTFVKLGQLIASSPGVFPAPLANAALRCLDEVKPFPGEVASAMIAEDLGTPPSQIFKEFDEHPLSAASIGQVHACVLPDGRDAVIKLQRPDIRERMATDLRIMHRVAQTMDRRTRMGRSVNVLGVIEDLHAVTSQELNPALEAHRQARFREALYAFGDNQHVAVPEVYWDYCGPHMICMERMSGVPLDDFETIRARGVDGELALRRAIKAWVEAAFVHGPFHGDLHAGNLWVLDDGRVTYLDFGIMGELEPQWRALLRDLFMTTMIDGDWTRIVRAFRRVGAVDDTAGTDEDIARRFELVFGPMLDTGISEISIGEVLGSIVQMMDQILGGTPRELLLIVKQFLYFERYSKELAPEWTIARDLFLVRNIFPAEVAAKCAESGIELPD